MKLLKLTTFLVLSVLLLSSCVNKQMMAKESGFFKTYDDIKENKDFEGIRVYIAKDVDFSKYKNIYISPIKIVASLKDTELTKEQKVLFKQVQSYLTLSYKKILNDNSTFSVVEDKDLDNTLIYEGAISAVEVHFDDMGIMNMMPMMLVSTAISRATFKHESIRILGESRISDAKSGKVLIKMMRLNKGKEVKVQAEKLTFKDVKPTLDLWLKDTNKNIVKIKNMVQQHG